MVDETKEYIKNNHKKLQSKKRKFYDKLTFMSLFKQFSSIYQLLCISSLSRPKHIKLTLIFAKFVIYCLTTSITLLFKDDKELLDNRNEANFDDISGYDIFLVALSLIIA